MGNNKNWYVQRVSAAPPMSEVKGPPSRHQRPCRCARLAKELGGLRRDPEHHLRARQPVFGVTAEVPTQKPLAALTHGCFRTSFGPAINPSSDVECPVRTFPILPFPFRPSSARSMLPLTLPEPNGPTRRLRVVASQDLARRSRRRTCRTLWAGGRRSYVLRDTEWNRWSYPPDCSGTMLVWL